MKFFNLDKEREDSQPACLPALDQYYKTIFAINELP